MHARRARGDADQRLSRPDAGDRFGMPLDGTADSKVAEGVRIVHAAPELPPDALHQGAATSIQRAGTRVARSRLLWICKNTRNAGAALFGRLPVYGVAAFDTTTRGDRSSRSP